VLTCPQIKKLESIRGVSFHARDHEGFNVAIWASKKQQVQVLRYLIEHHADSLNATDLNGTTVLGFAFIDMNKRSLHTIHTLLDSELMDLEQKENDGITTFFRAVRSDNIQAARALVDREANVNAINPINGMTPLHYAAGFGKSPEMVRYLVEEAGANLNIRAADGMTPLEFAKTREETPQSSKDIKYEIIEELERTTARNE
jgi:ankyrin repeat protein